MSDSINQNNNSSIKELNWQESILYTYFDQDEINKGIKVAIYFNLYKKTFSVRSRHKSNYGLVMFHADNLMLNDVKFVVREKGREKVIKEKSKNVHAFCYGTIDVKSKEDSDKGRLISYNPYKSNHFYYIDDGSKVSKLKRIQMKVVNKRGVIWELE